MKKMKFSILILFVLLTACNNQKLDFNLLPSDNTDCPDKEIVCWGDSMTAGFGVSEAAVPIDGATYDISYLSYPEILQGLTGMNTYNYGVPGATSEEIAVMQGGMIPDRDLSYYDTIDYDILWQAQEHAGDVLVLEIGSNGGWANYDDLIAQYNAIISHSGCNEYIIIGDTDDPLTSADPEVEQQAADNAETGIGIHDTTWESALRAAFKSHFINMRVFMIHNGLSIAGLKSTEMDEAAEKYGNISVQLRSDWTHFNSYGYYVQAVAVYQKGQQLGYWH